MWNWLRRLWRRRTAQQLDQLTFRVSPEERELVEFWAERNGTTVSEWLRDLVTQAIPTNERRKFEARYQLGEAMDFADQLMEEESGPKLLPMLSTEDEDEPQSKPTILRVPKNHICAWLDDETFPAYFSATTCFGTCDHKQQRGRPCFWPSQTAHQCSWFRNAKVKDRT